MPLPKTMHFSGKLYFYFVALIPISQHKSGTVKKLQARKEKKAAFLDIFTEVKCTERVPKGIIFLLEEEIRPRHWVLTHYGGRTLSESRQMPALLFRLASGARGTIRECQRAWQSVTFARSLFLLITIIIIIFIIIIFIIFMNTVSHLLTPKDKPIHGLCCDTNMVGLTCISFYPPPPLQVCTHSCIHSFIHSSTAGIRGLLPNILWSALIGFH